MACWKSRVITVLAGACTVLAGEVQWQTGKYVSETKSPEALQGALTAASKAGGSHAVVQFRGPLSGYRQEELAANGLHVLNYLGDNAYFAAVKGSADIQALCGEDCIVDVADIKVPWKLSDLLNREVTPEWAKVGENEAGSAIIATYILFHQDVPLADGVALIELYGGTIRDSIFSLNGLVVEISQDAIKTLATNDTIMYIEQALPQMTSLNAQNRVLSQANQAADVPYLLDGTGVNVLVFDSSSARASHQDFGGRLTVRDSSGTSTHPTHVAGTIGGDGAASGGTNAGMAPGVTMQSYGFETGGGGGTFLYSNPGDIEADYNQAINVFGVDISNNSIGTNTARNGFNCDITGDYGVTAALIDSIVTGSLGEPFRIVWANGNERGSSRCGTSFFSTAPPAGAKNHITVGSVDSDTDLTSSFSSWGPVDDGRMKPDVSAPGCQDNGDGGVTSPSAGSDTSYASLCGTSMAAPTLTGCAALLIEDWRNQFGGPDPRNSTLKAIFAQTAEDRGNVGPDYKYGYGSIRVRNAIDLMRLGNFAEDTVDNGQTVPFSVDVAPGESELRVTIAWDDAPAVPNVAAALVNDIDLRLVSPTDTIHLPWTLNPASPDTPAAQTQADHVNNIEQVFVANPTPGTWRVEIIGFNIPQGPQTFSMVTTGDLETEPAILISLTEGAPAALLPGESRNMVVRIREIDDTISGTPQLHFRYDNGDFLMKPLSPIGGDLWRAELPAPTCDATPEFFISASGTLSGEAALPGGGQTGPFEVPLDTSEAVFDDNFEANLGWSVQNNGLTDGAWERGTPVGGGDRGDPGADFDGSGQCYLTDNVDGNSDVDGGTTSLLSPTFDIAGDNDAMISYALWYTNNAGDDPNNDIFSTFVSNNNGGDWVLAQEIGPQSQAGWVVHTFRVADFVTPTSQVRVRFDASDLNGGSVVEAGIDAVQVLTISCDPLPDCNENSIVDADDIADERSLDENDNSIPDECEQLAVPGDMNCDGVVSVGDINPFVLALTDPAAYAAQFPDCDALNGDCNDDDTVSVGDINCFVALVTGS